MDILEYMSYKHFCKVERCELSILLKKGYSYRSIASVLKKNPSSVSREVKSNSVNGQYDPDKAQHKAKVKRKDSKYQGMKIRDNPELEAYVRNKLQRRWSPEQIVGRLNLEHGQTVISRRVIYKYVHSRYGQPFLKYLKHRGGRGRNDNHSKFQRDVLQNRILIDRRPKVINDRKRYGDFEGDTLGVPKFSHQTLAAIVERKSRYFLATKIFNLSDAVEGFKELLSIVPVRSLTLDNGFENSRYQELGVTSYFCHPYASWEKGSIENAFNIVREYIPKKARLKDYTQEDISAMLEEMNSTPRKCLNYRTPKEVFEQNYLKKCCT